MKDQNGFHQISIEELRQWMDEERDFVVIDTLPEDHYTKIHLPDAKNICVFQVIFLDEMKKLVPEKEREIVVYGSSDLTRDAVAAAAKLVRSGYRRVYVLTGGLKAWKQAGHALAGQDQDAADDVDEVKLEDRTYVVDTEQSVIEWTGRNHNTKHFGTLRLSKGTITVRDGAMSGDFEIDMRAIKNKSLEGDELQPVLIAHLQSDDFFFVDKFPVAAFRIESGRALDRHSLSAPNYEIEGTLELRGVREKIEFPATVNRLADGALGAEAHFDIDRTQWKVIYGSSRYFQHLGMHLVFDLISVELRIVAR